MLRLTHEARLIIARAYMAGEYNNQPLDGVMVRLLLASLETEHRLQSLNADQR